MKWILTLLFSLMPLISFAQGNCSLCTTPPLICPPRNWLITIGISPFLVQDLSGNYYGGFTGQNAGTMSLWTFIIGPYPAPTAQAAFNKFNQVLPTIQQVSTGPVQVSSQNWQCTYSNLYGIRTYTVYPPIGCFNPSAP